MVFLLICTKNNTSIYWVYHRYGLCYHRLNRGYHRHEVCYHRLIRVYHRHDHFPQKAAKTFVVKVLAASSFCYSFKPLKIMSAFHFNIFKYVSPSSPGFPKESVKIFPLIGTFVSLDTISMLRGSTLVSKNNA